VNILITTPIFPPEIGGPATYTMEVARRLQTKGHKIRIVAFTDGKPQTENLEVKPVKVRYKILGTVFRQIRLFFTTLFASRGMELIYAQDPVVVGLCSFIIGKLIRKPVIIRVGGDALWESEFEKGKTDKNLEDFLQSSKFRVGTKMRFSLHRFVFKHVNKLITPSYFLKEILTIYYKVHPVKISVIHNSVDFKDLESVSGRPRVFNKHIITVGRLIRLKKIDIIMKVVKELSEKFPGISLSIVGEGPEKGNLQRLSKELEIDKQVEFHGRVNHDETIKLLQESDLLVLNSVSEGFPHTVIEAMVCRVPLVATSVKGVKEVIDDGKTGLLASSDDELRIKIAQLINDEGLRKKLATNALTLVKQKFTWEVNLPLLEKELETVLHNRS